MAYNDSPYITVTAGEALTVGQGVRIDEDGEAVVCGIAVPNDGIVFHRDVASGAKANIKLANAPGTHEIKVAGAYNVGDILYPAASGKFSTTAAGAPRYILLEASAADGDNVEALRYPHVTGGRLNAIADTTLLASQSGMTVTNLGASGAVVFNLPTDAPAGTVFHAVVMVAQDLTINPPDDGGIMIGGSQQSDGTAFSANAINESATFTCVGSNDWVASAVIGTWS